MKKSFLKAADNVDARALDGSFDGIKPEKVSKKTVSDITDKIVKENGKKEKRPAKIRFIALAAAVLCMTLILGAVIGVFNRSGKVQALDLMEGIEPNDPGQVRRIEPEESAKVTDFAVRLFKQTVKEDGNNVLISPLSVLCALAMTANGAEGETLSQMEQTLGMSVDGLNEFFRSYLNTVANSKTGELKPANSVWFTDDERFTVERDFLQTNADYYGANAYRVRFDDKALKDINNWVSKKTDGMIDKIIDSFPDGDTIPVMYLVNALCFDAGWENKFKSKDVNKGTFTTENGEKRRVKMMASFEDVYFDDGKATGFLKYYKDRRYAFVAMLPNKGVTLDEYIASLDGQAIYDMLSHRGGPDVEIRMPKFTYEYSTEMSDALKTMGINKAFDKDNADFSGIGTSDAGNIFLNRVIHKTFISVDEAGTRAGAVHVIEHGELAGGPSRSVYLDRPFVYMLVDTETNIPFFIGTVTDIK